MNVELAEEVRDHIIAHPEKHNQQRWQCGTTACIAGHAVMLSDTKWRLVDDYGFTTAAHPHRGTTSVFMVGRDLLGLTHEQAQDLFYCYSNELALEKLENLIKDHAGDRK